MSADARVRKAWVSWVLELEHSKSLTEQLALNTIRQDTAGRDLMRLAFEAGYRSKRRDNATKENKPCTA